MLSIEGVYQNGQVVLKEKVDINQPVKVVVMFLENEEEILANTNNRLLGLFSDDIKLIDDIQESAMQTRENHLKSTNYEKKFIFTKVK